MSNNATHHKLHMVKCKGKWQQCCEWWDGGYVLRTITGRVTTGITPTECILKALIAQENLEVE